MIGALVLHHNASRPCGSQQVVVMVSPGQVTVRVSKILV